MSEPFLNPACADMIVYAYEKGHKLFLYTTLVGMNYEHLEKIKNVKFENGLILHLPDADGNAKIPLTQEYLRMLTDFFKYFEKQIHSGKYVSRKVSIHGAIHPKAEKYLKAEGIEISNYKNNTVKYFTRAGNMEVDNPEFLITKQPVPDGRIKCVGNFRSIEESVIINKDNEVYFDNQKVYELIPNGNVVLCCMDFGLKHILGNLKECDYKALFTNNPEWDFIQKGMNDSSMDILCRKCESAISADCFNVISRK
jgi:hypothetical protein